MADEPTPQPADKTTMAAQADVEQFRQLMQAYGMPVLAGIILASGVFLGIKAYQSRRQGKAERAAQALAAAVTSVSFREVLENYADTPSAPIAQLGLASRYYSDARYDEALAEYGTFELQYPDHPMRIAVGVCKAQCLEASGRLDEALDAFAAFVESQPEHYMTVVAGLGKARCLEQLGRYDEARTAYEDIIAANPESEWAALSEESLQDVLKIIRAQTSAP